MGRFFSLSPLNDYAMNFYKSIQIYEEILFKVIASDEIIDELKDAGYLGANYNEAKKEFEKKIKEYNVLLNKDIYILDKDNSIFLEYLNEAYYWICIVSSIKDKYFLILDNKAKLPKDHKLLAELLTKTEQFLTDINYLLSEKTELDSDILLQTIIYHEEKKAQSHNPVMNKK